MDHGLEPLACQLYYFAHRPMSGLLNGYARGVHDNDEWRRRNLEHVCRHPPKVVIARPGPPGRDASLAHSQPELDRLLTEQYRRVAWSSETWTILALPPAQAFECPLQH